MPRINLLPWREQQRRERKLAFFVALGGAAGLAAVVAAVAYLLVGSMIDAQEQRNTRLRSQIKILDKQIEQINDLEQQKQKFISRMQIIEKLQRSRPEVVHLFDELVKVMPDGTYLTSVKQTGNKIKLEGVAQSSTRVSTLMRNIAASQWLRKPELEVVQTKNDSAGGSSFVLDVEQVNLSDQDDAAKQRPPMRAASGEIAMNLLEEMRALDPRDPGRWPLPVRALAVLACFILVSIALIYVFVWQDRMPELRQRENQEAQLRTEFRTKHSKAVNLSIYKQQLADIEKSFGALLRQLPSKTEVPNLLVDISQTGLAAALQEKLFQPGQEVKKDFYAELPIKIRLTGSYHDFGQFVSGIAALPRIVTLHDIQITPIDKSSGYDQLQLVVTAQTYRYLDDEEIAAGEAEKRKAEQSKRHGAGR